MTEKIFIIFIFLAFFAFIILTETFNRFRLKQKVKDQWGDVPYQARFDSEESLKEAWQIEKNLQPYDSEIDDLTWYDLDMFAVFEQLNATYSSVGSEYLYQNLRNYNWQPKEKLEELIRFYQEQPAKRDLIQFRFAQLGKQDHNFSKSYIAQKGKTTLGSLPFYLILGLLPIFGLLLFFLGQSAGIILTLISVVFNTLYYQIKKAKLETELNSMRYLVQTIACGKKLAKIDQPLQKELQTALKPLAAILQFAFSFRAKSYSDSDLMFEYLNMMFMLPFISYSFVLKKLKDKQQPAIRLWEILGQLEVAAAVLNFRTFMPLTCKPEFQEGAVAAKKLYHPLVEDAVVNPVDWQKTTLISGSNASGKSTYVKSIAISCILSQTINTAVAESFQLQRGHVLSSMAVEDNLFEGDSYFVAEIKSIKRLLEKVDSQQRCYCFIDEILKGTNTIERIAASSSIVHWLSQAPSLAMIATHDIELNEILKHDCAKCHFSEKITAEHGIEFDYRVKEGPALTRNAIALLKVSDYPQMIVAEAENAAIYFEQNRSWKTIDH